MSHEYTEPFLQTRRLLKSYYRVTASLFNKKLFFGVFFILFVNCLPKCSAVKGCVTFLLPDLVYKKSICNNEEYGFTSIPLDLPKKLSVLEITNQKISSLNSSSFAHLSSLTNLTLDANKISIIHKDTFSSVPNLKYLSLERNSLKLGNSSFVREALLHLRNLETLILYRNPIGFVPDSFFAPLRNLRFLVLSGAAKNGLQLAENAFEGLPQLELLDLSENQLHALPEGMKHSINQMQLKYFYLFLNSWNCDCNLRWLKVWFLRQGTKIKYSERRKTQNGEIYEAEPVCASPVGVSGKVILSKVPKPIQLTEFHCKPEIFTRSNKLKVTEMSNVTLSCNFRADPKGTVQWYKDGTLVQNHWPRVEYSQTQGMEFKATLTIRNVEPGDGGQWKCHLHTNVGTVNATYTLSIIQLASGGIEMRRTVMIVGTGVVALIVMLIIAGVLIYCCYGRVYTGANVYSAGKRRQPRAEGGMPNWGYNQPLNSANNNNNMYREAMITEEIIGGNSHTEITPRKRVMLSRNAAGEILQHESVPLTAGLQIEGGGPHETDLSVMQSLESGGTLRVSANPGYVPLQVTCGNSSLGAALVSAQSTSSVITATPLPDNCPVHGMGTMRATYSPCPIHGETLSRSQTPQIPIAIPSNPVYGTLSTSQYPYKPCPMHGDMLSTMQRKAPSLNTNGTQAASVSTATASTGTVPPTCSGSSCPTRSILRSKSPPKQPRKPNNVSVTLNTSPDTTAANTAANAMSTFVRASQVDDCLTDSDVTPQVDSSRSSLPAAPNPFVGTTDSSSATSVVVKDHINSSVGLPPVAVPPRVSSAVKGSSTPMVPATVDPEARHSYSKVVEISAADNKRGSHTGKLASVQNTIVEEDLTR